MFNAKFYRFLHTDVSDLVQICTRK